MKTKSSILDGRAAKRNRCHRSLPKIHRNPKMLIKIAAFPYPRHSFRERSVERHVRSSLVWMLLARWLMRSGWSSFQGGSAAAGTLLILIAALLTSTAASPSSFISRSKASASLRTVLASRELPGQYAFNKLGLSVAHRTTLGRNVRVAVIDLQIDKAHPDVIGAVVDRYDSTGQADRPHAHGTGIAGAILNVAPGAEILAVRVFSSSGVKSKTTADNVVRGLEWAVKNNAHIVNMSFAGPGDPTLAQALKAAYNKGVILIAAVGNAEAEAQPVFPASDPHVIAVTATDSEDRIFQGANRAAHVDLAAPGVKILVPAPAGEYQIMTGTSVAAAHVSGVVALMLERSPLLTPTEVRRILVQSARPIGPPAQLGAGLVDARNALRLSIRRSANNTVLP